MKAVNAIPLILAEVKSNEGYISVENCLVSRLQGDSLNIESIKIQIDGCMETIFDFDYARTV